MVESGGGRSTPKRTLKSPLPASKRLKADLGDSAPADDDPNSANIVSNCVSNCQSDFELLEIDFCGDAPEPTDFEADEQKVGIHSQALAAADMTNGEHPLTTENAAGQGQDSCSSQVCNPSLPDVGSREVSTDNYPDYGELFPSQTFDTRDELIDWVKKTGRENSMGIIIKSSNQGVGRGGGGLVMLSCERGGKYRRKKSGILERERASGSKKCHCPFLLRGSQLASGYWALHVMNGRHNHELKPPKGHSYTAKLTQAEMELITNLTKSNLKPKEILMHVKGAYQKNNSTVRHIYNARQKLRTLDASGRLILQQHLNSINDHGYRQFHRRDPETNVISELIFAHPKSVDLLRAFPYVLIMDCTNTSKKHDMPFLEVYGVASTDQNFPVAFAYLKSQQEDSYEWALQNIRSLFEPSRSPIAIVTCIDLALMTTVEKVYPESSHLLCRQHVQKEVELNCSQLCQDVAVTVSFASRWQNLVEARQEQHFNDFLIFLEQDYQEFPQVLSYVKDRWLIPYKDKIVSAWTDRTLHLGANSTDRVKGAHARLKRLLDSSKRNSWAMWRDIHILIELQLMDIKAELDRSPTTFPSFVLSHLYADLIGRVSCKALKLIESECKRVKEIGSDVMACGCYLRYTHGLPCAHELFHLMENNESIPVSSVNPFWTTLKVWESGKDFDPMAVWQDLFQEVLTKPIEEQKRLAHELHRLIKEETVTAIQNHEDQHQKSLPPSGQFTMLVDDSPQFGGMLNDQEQASPQSHCSDAEQSLDPCSEKPPLPPFVSDIPSFMVPFVASWDEVLGDGNCGYRVIAKLLMSDAEKWPVVRRDLWHEVCSRQELYAKVFCCEDVRTVLNGIAHWQGPAPRPHWMSMPDIGYVIATRYNIAFVCLSKTQSLTFMPLTASEGAKPPDRVVTVTFLACGDHYIALHMLDESPLPPLMCSWHQTHDASVDKWDAKFYERFKKYMQLKSSAGP